MEDFVEEKLRKKAYFAALKIHIKVISQTILKAFARHWKN